jgi:hypothetical protein
MWCDGKILVNYRPEEMAISLTINGITLLRIKPQNDSEMHSKVK